jgi:CHAT domain-containing protein/tetratricopeptide (TPR) repeat protein
MLAPFQRSSSAFLGSALLLMVFMAPAQAQLPDTSDELGKLEARILELWGTGKIADTLPLRKRVFELSSRKLGPDHPQTIQRAEDLGYVYVTVGRPDEAKLLFERVIRFKEAALSKKRDAKTAELLQLGQIYKYAERPSEAETLFKRTLASLEPAGGAGQKEVVDILFLHLGLLYAEQGRHAEEEAAFKRALAIQEKIQGSDPFSRITTVGILAMLPGVYENLGRSEDAEAFAKRYIATVEREPTLGDLAFGHSELAKIYASRGRYAEAETLYKRALAAEEKNKTSNDKLFLGHYLNSLSDLYYRQRRYTEAEQLAKRAIPLVAQVLGGETSWNAPSLTLARVQQAQGRHTEAEATYKRVLANYERRHGSESSAVAPVLADLAGLKQAQGNLPEAYELAKRATAALVRQVRTRSQTLTMAPGGQLRPTRLFHQPTFAAYLRAAAELANRSPERAPTLAAEGFEIAQWAQHSQAAAALSQMAARFAKGEGELARLVRERQDLVGRYRILDRKLTAALAKPTAERHQPQEETWRKDMVEVEKRISAIDAMFSQRFPDYAALASPEPLSVRDTQALLRPGEALYQLVLDDDRSFAWVVSRDAVRWHQVAMGRKALADQVVGLGCGLDATVWEAGGTPKPATGASPTPARAATPRERCRQLLGVETHDPAALPFDVARAHALYAALFSPFEEIIKDKHLLVVPTGALTTLPLQVLVTAAPSASLGGDQRYAKAAWLASRHPVTVLPSVASLKALRAAARKSTAQSPYAGFGNPLLSGPSGTDRSAWSRQTCAAPPSAGRQQVAALPGARGNVQDFFRGGRVDVAMIRKQQPLPETADEVCAVASELGASADDVFLGARATEGTLKSLNAKGMLKSWRVLHFATHGLVAGETQQIAANQAEPALMLTPPEVPSEEDDGLLTASEVAQLQLDADWVALSACNTASGDGAEAEALSGLTRAFLYAGSRALVVSHWPVNSEAAVRLVTGTFSELKGNAPIGRAEALRRAMLRQVREGGSRAHPSYWAPFVLVGEGG